MNSEHFTMKDLPVSEQPYEKCCELGCHMLSDAELLAVILRTGTANCRSIEVAINILNAHEIHKGLIGLHYLSMKELMSIEGIGKVKAVQLLCISELSKRLSRAKRSRNSSFRSPKDIADYFMEEMRCLSQEHVMLLLLDGKSACITTKVLTIGTINASLASTREIYKCAFQYDAVTIALLHNHPSGDSRPSSEDIAVTRQVMMAGQIMGIPLIDHIIIGDGEFTSMKECGYLSQ